MAFIFFASQFSRIFHRRMEKTPRNLVTLIPFQYRRTTPPHDTLVALSILLAATKKKLTSLISPH